MACCEQLPSRLSSSLSVSHYYEFGLSNFGAIVVGSLVISVGMLGLILRWRKGNSKLT